MLAPAAMAWNRLSVPIRSARREQLAIGTGVVDAARDRGERKQRRAPGGETRAAFRRDRQHPVGVEQRWRRRAGDERDGWGLALRFEPRLEPAVGAGERVSRGGDFRLVG